MSGEYADYPNRGYVQWFDYSQYPLRPAVAPTLGPNATTAVATTTEVATTTAAAAAGGALATANASNGSNATNRTANVTVVPRGPLTLAERVAVLRANWLKVTSQTSPDPDQNGKLTAARANVVTMCVARSSPPLPQHLSSLCPLPAAS